MRVLQGLRVTMYAVVEEEMAIYIVEEVTATRTT